jgi:hypothetical protein
VINGLKALQGPAMRGLITMLAIFVALYVLATATPGCSCPA